MEPLKLDILDKLVQGVFAKKNSEETENLDLVMQDISDKKKLAQQGLEHCLSLKKGFTNGNGNAGDSPGAKG